MSCVSNKASFSQFFLIMKLRRVCFNEFNKPESDEKFCQVLDSLKNDLTVGAIEFCRCPLSPAVLRVFLETLQCPNPNLTHLNLWSSRFSVEDLQHVCLGHSSHVSQLDLADNNLESQGLDLVLKSVQKSVSTLNLGYNKLNHDGGRVLAEYLKKDKNLKKLILYGNNLGAGLKDLMEAMCENDSLTHLNISHGNYFEQKDTDSLCRVLEQNTALLTLGLGGLGLGSEGCELFAESLFKNSTLTSLDFSTNQLCDHQEGEGHSFRGFSRFCHTLRNRPFAMVSLDLSNNFIGPNEGATMLAEALKSIFFLRHLILSGCQLQSVGVVSVCDALIDNVHGCQLMYLNLCSNNAGWEGGLAIARFILAHKHVSTLSRLAISDNALPKEAHQVLLEAVMQSGAMVWCYGINNAANDVCTKNKAMHARVKACVLALLCARSLRRAPVVDIPKDIFVLLAKFIWNTRTDCVGWKRD